MNSKDEANQKFDNLERFRYSKDDVSNLPIVNAILLELICARFIKTSFNPDEDMEYIFSNLLARTNYLGTQPTPFYPLAEKTVQHIKQLMDPKTQPVMVLDETTLYEDPDKQK